LRGTGVTIPQQDVVQPGGQHTVLVHQVTDRLQHRLEVVLLGLWGRGIGGRRGEEGHGGGVRAGEKAGKWIAESC
jgi:hypothetical protein